MDGFNGAVLAYGQTSAGKSWTMEGPSIWDADFQGVVPRCVSKLFEDIEKAPATIQFQLVVSYYEIYCEKVRDLLNPMQTNMKVRETKTEGFIVQDVTEVYCTDKESVLRVIEMGKTNRVAAPTLMNAESSRSHSIFSILVDQQDTASGRHKKGILYLVDLAGSEKVGKTGAKGMRLEEAKNINSSLTSLGMCINALCDGAPHVPYRDSKLTMLLMEALGGNSKTTLIICCTPEADHSPETLSTLRFGERAKRIQTNAKVNEELSAAELKVHLQAAKKELAALVGVLGRTSQSVGEAVATSSVVGLVPLVDVLKKCLAKSSVKGDKDAEGTAEGTEGAEGVSTEGDDAIPTPGLVGDTGSVKEVSRTADERVAELTARMASLEEEVELEKLKSEQEHEKCVFKDTEVAALQATIAELEERLVKANLQAKRAQEAKVAAEELLSAASAATEAQRLRADSMTDHSSSPGKLRHNSLADPSAAAIAGEASSPGVLNALSADAGEPLSPLAEQMRGFTPKESREFLIKLERELITTGTNFDINGNFKSPTSLSRKGSMVANKPVDGETAAPAADTAAEAGGKKGQEEERKGLDTSDSAEMLRFLNIHETDIAQAGADADAEGNAAYTKEAYETHVRRLMFILDQEQQARLRVEDKLEEARQQLLRQSAKIMAAGPAAGSGTKSKGFLQNLFGGGGLSGLAGGSPAPSSTAAATSSSSNPLASLSNLVTDTLSPGTRRQSSLEAADNARRFNYSDRESALAETLEIAQERIMELVSEMESTQEAQMIVLETKESVLRSLARQNTHLAMERDALNQKVEALTAKTEQLSTLLRSVQQAQAQPLAPSLPGPGSIGAQSFRMGGPGQLQRFGSNIRVMGPLATEGELAGVTPRGFNLKANASFRMGGKPPTGAPPTPSAATPASGLPPAHPAAALSPTGPAPAGGLPAPVVPPGGLAAMTARSSFFFSGGGTIQRNRPSAATSRSSPYPPSSTSPLNASQSTSLSSSPASSFNDLTTLDPAASPHGIFETESKTGGADVPVEGDDSEGGGGGEEVEPSAAAALQAEAGPAGIAAEGEEEEGAV